MTDTTADAHLDPEYAGDHHHDGPRLAHHFDTYQQQFDTGKLGIWLFLAQEILFFSGLFVAYIVYRAMHPEIFVWAHYYLDTQLGAINTGVLIVSSLTAAWAVRCAQQANKSGLVLNIVITILCAFGFLGIKYVEYSHKFHDGLMWGPKDAKLEWSRHNPKEEVWELHSFRAHHPEVAAAAEAAAKDGKSPVEIAAAARKAGGGKDYGIVRPKHSNIFFGIYFFMTGLHGIHVIAGIIMWIWLLVRAVKGQFGPKYFGPIDYGALYWHLVDLIWIYLFPLLYLIH